MSRKSFKLRSLKFFDCMRGEKRLAILQVFLEQPCWNSSWRQNGAQRMELVFSVAHSATVIVKNANFVGFVRQQKKTEGTALGCVFPFLP